MSKPEVIGATRARATLTWDPETERLTLDGWDIRAPGIQPEVGALLGLIDFLERRVSDTHLARHDGRPSPVDLAGSRVVG